MAPIPRQPEVAPDPWVSRRLGKYQILKRLGQGGMGVVYEAQDVLLNRSVALKLLPETMSTDAAILQRFRLEAQAAARLNHANTVAIYEVDQDHGVHYLAMELVRGGSIQDSLTAEGALDWLTAARVIADVCRGLAAAHATGLIHRDIKPANIMRSREGVVKLADFGLAKVSDHGGQSLTGSGFVLGTPNYMSPEQCRSEPLDERSDLYSLGATLYALLTGHPPFDGEGPMQVMYAHCSLPVPDPRAVDATILDACAALVMKAMAKNPTDRYATATAMLADLEAVVTAPEAAGNPTRRWPPLPKQPTPLFPTLSPIPKREQVRAGFKAVPWLAWGGAAAVFIIAWWMAGRVFDSRSGDVRGEVPAGKVARHDADASPIVVENTPESTPDQVGDVDRLPGQAEALTPPAALPSHPREEPKATPAAPAADRDEGPPKVVGGPAAVQSSPDPEAVKRQARKIAALRALGIRNPNPSEEEIQAAVFRKAQEAQQGQGAGPTSLQSSLEEIRKAVEMLKDLPKDP